MHAICPKQNTQYIQEVDPILFSSEAQFTVTYRYTSSNADGVMADCRRFSADLASLWEVVYRVMVS